MASRIWLGNLKPEQNPMSNMWDTYLNELRDGQNGLKAIIAKGNIIEGIEAKE